jgi:hypothetical protein
MKSQMIRKNILVIGLVILSLNFAFAREGMWIPTLLNKYNIEEMKQMGFKLTADDIYSVNQVSMKDAVVLFGTGCTGELISNEGLLITNHHCGYDAIQNHSTVEHDYLTNGFWAINQEEELPNPELRVSLLERMEDVTAKVLAETEGKPKDSVAIIINRNTRKIISEAGEKGKYEAAVQPIFYGNQYFLYVYQVFRDIRLVGAPPSSIGKFGGDTDNWMWPRHTGDFSLFRIYAGKDNQPASYSPDNVPYKPKKFFKISIKGIQPEDFTLVLGYPARTQEFLPSQAIRQIMEQGDPDKIEIRDLKLNILSADMEKDAKVRIQYASKYQNTSNAWKKWQGEVKGLRRLNAVETKQKLENDFRNWIGANTERQKKYGNVLPQLEQLYNELAPYTKAFDYYSEIVQRGTDLFSIISYFDAIGKRWDNQSAEDQQKLQKAIETKIEEHLNEFNPSTDEKVFAALIGLYAKEMDQKFLPEDFKSMMLKSTQDELIAKLYRQSVFSNPEKLKSLASGLNTKKLKLTTKDPAFRLFRSLKNSYEMEIEPHFNSIQKQIDQALKTYVAGILEMNEGKKLWPDANKTLRVSYGKVEGYKPMDGVRYNYFTTLKGIMEKDNPAVYDYNVPQKLREIYQQKDYGRYGNKDEMSVCFTASNHTTGGNSGSPVLNANGDLIGLNFDRCWEGTMSDLMFDPDRCRNIVLDIRYALFIIDKFAGAGYLLDEMEIRE